MRGYWGAVCFGLGFSFVATACPAATIAPIKGEISINRGQGFLKMNGAVEAKAGDAVMVSPHGSALVSYPDGCTVNLRPGMVMTIPVLSPCASGSYAEEQDDNPDHTFKLETAGIIGGVLGIAGLITYEITQSGKPGPASP
jgi:hypothetical protein